MRVLVLGATGATGREVTAQALEQGHSITVLVRHPERLENMSKAINVRIGDVADGSPALANAVTGQDAVISALGVGKSLKSDGLIARSAPLIIRAMSSEDFSRLIFLSACGVGRTMEDVPLLPRLFMRLVLRDIFADKEAGENYILKSNLDWTIVYPTMLTNGPRTGKYRAAEHLELRGFPTLSRANVAHFLVRQLSERQYSRKGVVLSS